MVRAKFVQLSVVGLALVILLSACGSSTGGVEPVSAADLQEALAGNTAIGNWLGTDYRQFFDADGATIYLPEGGAESMGKWQVVESTGLFESLWNDRPPWTAYEVHRNGDTWFWTGQGVELSEFVIVEGNQLNQ